MSHCDFDLVLIPDGYVMLQVEATEVFFAVTKLFQSNDAGLRRLVYLMIKELSPSSDEVNAVSDAQIWFCLFHVLLFLVV